MPRQDSVPKGGVTLVNKALPGVEIVVTAAAAPHWCAPPADPVEGAKKGQPNGGGWTVKDKKESK